MLKQILITFALISFAAVFTMAQDQTTTEKTEKGECSPNCCSGHDSNMSMTMAHMEMDSTHNSHHEMNSTGSEDISIVREGEIDLVAIDVNGDGMVYQDQMCWNVISDEPGKCPLCGMTLKEVTIEKAKENLVENDFEVKEE